MSGAPDATAIWHDVECASYAADLPRGEELATAAGGEVLDLGCGTGRVALHLARRGHPVIGLDRVATLLATLAERAKGLPVEPLHADAREFALDRQVSLGLAPMQTLQLLEGRDDRLACLRRVAAALRPGGRFAAAILEAMPPPDDAPPPLPERSMAGSTPASLSRRRSAPAKSSSTAAGRRSLPRAA
jgi:SAM-dependent methyltransferase